MKGTLYIVSTPIGNLEDITLRALRVLRQADIIAAEDTRRSLKLLTHYGISKPLISYWKEKEKGKAGQILKILLAGRSVALVSDAGTPGISDPGAVLIQRAIEEDVSVVSIPGPSAFLAALSLSGLPAESFTFIGFLPARNVQRKKILTELRLEPRTLIFYESPHRILDTLEDMEMTFRGRKAAVVKEITKIHEEVLRGVISGLLDKIRETTIAGEYVIIVEGRQAGKNVVTPDIISEIGSLMKKGLGRKEAAKKVAGAYGISKKELYDKSLNEFP